MIVQTERASVGLREANHLFDVLDRHEPLAVGPRLGPATRRPQCRNADAHTIKHILRIGASARERTSRCCGYHGATCAPAKRKRRLFRAGDATRTMTITSPERSAFEGYLLQSFHGVLGRYDLRFHTHRIGGIAGMGGDAPGMPSHLTAHVWELAFSCRSHVAYSAWAALVPGATPDLLDVIAPNALESPGPVPRYVVELPALSPVFQQRLLRHWAHATQAHDELQALLASITPDAATAVRLLTELCAAAAWCNWAHIAPDGMPH